MFTNYLSSFNIFAFQAVKNYQTINAVHFKEEYEYFDVFLKPLKVLTNMKI